MSWKLDITAHLSPPRQPLEEQKWRLSAACLHLDTDMFFPPKGDIRYVLQAKAVCVDCPVKSECLEFGLHEPWGVWGGTSARERRRIVRARKRLKTMLAATA